MKHARYAVPYSLFRIASLKSTDCMHKSFLYHNHHHLQQRICLRSSQTSTESFQNAKNTENVNTPESKQLNSSYTDTANKDVTKSAKLQYQRNIRLLPKGPELSDFFQKQNHDMDTHSENIPYVQSLDGNKQRVYLEIYGCQMNVNDAEVVSAILKQSNYEITTNLNNANIILLVTCAIRDNAEQKIWNRLRNLRHLKRKKLVTKIGLLGCMAERLKHKIIEEEKMVDVIAGPDSYKDLPRLLSVSSEREAAINVMLSFDETYADITPVRLNPESKTAFVTIMRGCDNMCTYCIVPFTRGRERSRPVLSILDEIQKLSDQGIKEVTLLGQNVNSYRDTSETNFYDTKTNLVKGFNTVYKNKLGGLRFSDLLDRVSRINPEMRIRFTSPHPKDFPDEVVHLIAERANICKMIHLPAQSGNSNVLERMRRGYTREAYLNLVSDIRRVIPNITFSSDFIAGFCDETEEEFEETLTLLQEVKYGVAYLFAYSMREKTSAYRRYVDNVDNKIKLERVQRMSKVYRSEADKLNKSQIGQQQLILIEGESKRSVKDLQGRNEGNIKVIIPKELIPTSYTSSTYEPIKNGDYVAVHVCDANSQVLRGAPLYHSSIGEFYSRNDELLDSSIAEKWNGFRTSLPQGM